MHAFLAHDIVCTCLLVSSGWRRILRWYHPSDSALTTPWRQEEISLVLMKISLRVTGVPLSCILITHSMECFSIFNKDWSKVESHRGDQHIVFLDLDILVESAQWKTCLRGYDGGRRAVPNAPNGVLYRPSVYCRRCVILFVRCTLSSGSESQLHLGRSTSIRKGSHFIGV